MTSSSFCVNQWERFTTDLVPTPISNLESFRAASCSSLLFDSSLQPALASALFKSMWRINATWPCCHAQSESIWRDEMPFDDHTTCPRLHCIWPARPLMALKALCPLLSALCPLISPSSIRKDWYLYRRDAHPREALHRSLWKKHANPLRLNEICALILLYRFKFEVINCWKITWVITCVATWILDRSMWIVDVLNGYGALAWPSGVRKTWLRQNQRMESSGKALGGC